MYEYRAVVLRIVDGDTLHLDVDLGFDVKRRDGFRLQGINCPEMSTAAGKVSKAWLEKRLPVGTVVSIHTYKDKREKYGRYLATIFMEGANINEELVTEGMAVRYMT